MTSFLKDEKELTIKVVYNNNVIYNIKAVNKLHFYVILYYLEKIIKGDCNFNKLNEVLIKD